jgi:CubicO group peptidase (beta-lactamase class C family)
MKKLIFFLVCFVCNAPAKAQIKDTLAQKLTKELEEISRLGHINGFSVAIVNSDTILYTKGFGFSDVVEKTGYTANTMQPIASISKTVIGIALLKAQELGKLDLDDPINKYLPFKVANPYFPKEAITVGQLASHTSTILDAKQYEGKGYVLREVENTGTKANKNFRSPEQLMDYSLFLEKIFSEEGEWYQKKNFIKKKPGEIFEYSNLGAGLAALVLENAVKQPFHEFTKIHVFEPLKMMDTGWFLKDLNYDNFSKLYADKDTELAPYQLVNYPDGGLITSSKDLAKYLKELISGHAGEGQLLALESYRDLFKGNLGNTVIHKDRKDNKYNDEYDMGIFMGMSAQGQMGHTGGDPGVTTFMFFNPETRIGKILLANTDLSKEGIKKFIEIWKILESYESKL